MEVDVPWVDPERVLVECEGFLVDGSDGREIGVVDRVEPSERGGAAALLVAGGLFGGRQLRVEADGVETVLPEERRLIVDPSRVTAVGDTGPS
jgi:hypothetical protein